MEYVPRSLYEDFEKTRFFDEKVCPTFLAEIPENELISFLSFAPRFF